ncbi:phage portal protein [Helicobacter sp. 12S02634-8]|uniref:phage portal protein n=1 Tax=Helicobacter sp. 12S02634-8 TaxID=1476199 RepID=UPI000BA75B54|nr:phage portal protein [Helicobacter sp. 12S02634-8]PAF46424.1 phage portal protein [Helicobacter sp. 12S02634-8]
MKIMGLEIKRAGVNSLKTKTKSSIAKAFSAPFDYFAPKKAYERQIMGVLRNINLDSSSSKLLFFARNLAISSPPIYGYLQLMESEIYGDKGFTLDIDSTDEVLNHKIESLWAQWGSVCDFECGYDFKDFERFILLHYLRDGECFIYLQDTRDGLRLRIIPPEFIDYTYDDNDKIRKGIEFDDNNRPIAYYVNQKNQKRLKLSAENVIHLKKVFYSAQVRGISHITPVMLKVMQSDKYIESVIAQANIASRFSLIATPKDNEEFGGGVGDLEEESQDSEPKTIEIEDGRIITMNDNYKIEPLNINHNPNVGDFMIHIDRMIARALGISYASYTGNLAEVNFSSSRSGILQERRGFKRIQFLLERKIHQPIFERFIKNAILKGDITPKEAEQALKNASFKKQGYGHIDPLKEVSTQKMQIELGLKSIKEIIEEEGVELGVRAKNIKDSNDMLLDELIRLKSISSATSLNLSLNDNDNDKEEK